MDEGRKRVLAILTPRLKEWGWDGRAGAPACEGFVMTALRGAERILATIDRKHGVLGVVAGLPNKQ